MYWPKLSVVGIIVFRSGYIKLTSVYQQFSVQLFAPAQCGESWYSVQILKHQIENLLIGKTARLRTKPSKTPDISVTWIPSLTIF